MADLQTSRRLKFDPKLFAMIIIAPKSSTIADAFKKTFKDETTRLPKSDKMPIEKAISVDIGTPQPARVAVS